MNAMQTMINAVLKNMGINPEGLMEKAKELFDRFHKLDTRLEGVTEERMVELEAEVNRLKEHLRMDEPETFHTEPTPEGDTGRVPHGTEPVA